MPRIISAVIISHQFVYNISPTLSLRVSKTGNENICGPKNTYWGCVHEGSANIQNWEKYYGKSTSETVTIEYATGKSYRFSVEHTFDYNELYYSNDHRMVGELTITVNNEVLGTFSHPNEPKTDTHNQDQSVNAAYKGIIYVNVDCDNECQCSVQTVLPTCLIRAEIKFPTIENAPEFGYHNDL